MAPLPIRAPLTHDAADDDDSEFDVSTNASLSDTASHSATPLVADSDEQDYVSEDEFSPTHGATLRVTPFAQLSTYDDEESEVEDDDELLGVAPRIKVLDFEDEEEEEEENVGTLASMNSLPVSQSLLSDEFSNFSLFNDVCSDNSIELQDDSVGIALDDVLGGGGVGYDDECSIASGADVMLQFSPDNLKNEQFGEVKVRVVEDELGKEELNRLNKNEGITMNMLENDDSIMQRKLLSEVEDYEDGEMGKQNGSSVHDLEEKNCQPHTDFRITYDAVLGASAETVEYGPAQRSLANGCQGFAFDQERECEQLVSMTKSVIYSKVKLDDSSACFESIDDACEDKQIQCIGSSELLDPMLLQETAYFENDLSEADLGVSQQHGLFCNCCSNEFVETGLSMGGKVNKEANAELNTPSQKSKKDGSACDGGADAEQLVPVAAELFKEQISALSFLWGSKSLVKNCQQDENMILAMDDVKGRLTNVAIGDKSDVSTVAVTTADESSVIFLKDPGSFSSSLHCKAQAGIGRNICDKEKDKVQRIEGISVLFLRLVQRVNLSLEDSLVTKVLCRLVAGIGRRSNQELVIQSAKVSAKKLEEDNEDDLDFSLNILVLGKSGVGKSATINSIFGDMKAVTNAYEPATTSIKEVSGTLGGVKIRILDTPGLMSPLMDQAYNGKILSSIKRYMKKFPVDVILYVDRVDSQTRDMNDFPMFKSITSSLGPSIWQRAILTLTHAASTPLDGPSGSPLSYEVSIAQKSYLVQQSISHAVDDPCLLRPSFMCPVSLVENHPLCGEFVLPNGLGWTNQLLALCISLKILSQVSSESGPQTLYDHLKHFFFQNDTPPLSHTCSSLLQSHGHLKFEAKWN